MRYQMKCSSDAENKEHFSYILTLISNPYDLGLKEFTKSSISWNLRECLVEMFEDRHERAMQQLKNIIVSLEAGNPCDPEQVLYFKMYMNVLGLKLIKILLLKNKLPAEESVAKALKTGVSKAYWDLDFHIHRMTPDTQDPSGLRQRLSFARHNMLTELSACLDLIKPSGTVTAHYPSYEKTEPCAVAKPPKGITYKLKFD